MKTLPISSGMADHQAADQGQNQVPVELEMAQVHGLQGDADEQQSQGRGQIAQVFGRIQQKARQIHLEHHQGQAGQKTQHGR